MSFEALRESVETRLADNYSTTPVAYANVPFTPPTAQPWVRLTINTGLGAVAGHSGDGFGLTIFDLGLVSVQVFTPDGEGTKNNWEIVDEIIPIYENTRFDGILVNAATVNQAGTNNGWYQTNITLPFRRARNV